MRIPNYFFFACFFTLMLLNPFSLFAQQSAWELVRKDFWGKIAIDPTNPDIIYVSPGHVPELGLHKSTDGGKTWVNYQQGYEGLSELVNGIVIDPNNPQQLWVYGGPGKGVARSEDGGMTAVRADTGIYYDHHGYSVSAFAYDNKRRILYAGDLSAGGIYRSFSRGRRWELVYGYDAGLSFNPAFFFVEEDNGWLYSGTLGHGMWRSKDLGVTWVQLDPKVLGGPPPAEPISFIAKVPNSHTLYATAKNGRIFKSYNLGESWNLISDATTDSSELSGGLLISSLDTNYIYVGGRAYSSPFLKGGFFLSRNGGKKWELYHFGLPQFSLSQYTLWCLTQSSDSKHLYMSLFAGDQSIYKLKQTLLTSVREHPSSTSPKNFYLMQNYPNPFNIQTRIEFTIAKKELILLDVFNISGEHLVNLFNGQIDSGTHLITWNGKNSKGGDAVSGVYLIRLKAGKQVLNRKMLLIR